MRILSRGVSPAVFLVCAVGGGCASGRADTPTVEPTATVASPPPRAASAEPMEASASAGATGDGQHLVGDGGTGRTAGPEAGRHRWTCRMSRSPQEPSSADPGAPWLRVRALLGLLIRLREVFDQRGNSLISRAGRATLRRAAHRVRPMGEASTGAAAVPLGAGPQPQLVLMDLQMPASKGIAASRQILAAPATT